MHLSILLHADYLAASSVCAYTCGGDKLQIRYHSVTTSYDSCCLLTMSAYTESKADGPEKAVVPDGSDSSESRADAEAALDINENSLLRKIDLKLLPAVGILYLLSFLDRSNGEQTAPSSWSSVLSTKVMEQWEMLASKASQPT